MADVAHAASSTEGKAAPSVRLLPALSKAPMPIDLTLQILQSYAIHTETIDIHVQVSMIDKNVRVPALGSLSLSHSLSLSRSLALLPHARD